MNQQERRYFQKRIDGIVAESKEAVENRAREIAGGLRNAEGELFISYMEGVIRNGIDVTANLLQALREEYVGDDDRSWWRINDFGIDVTELTSNSTIYYKNLLKGFNSDTDPYLVKLNHYVAETLDRIEKTKDAICKLVDKEATSLKDKVYLSSDDSLEIMDKFVQRWSNFGKEHEEGIPDWPKFDLPKPDDGAERAKGKAPVKPRRRGGENA